MDPIQHEKRLEVSRLYLLGYSYSEIEKKVGVSHGSIVNIIKELEAGHLTVPGVASDEVNDLHQLSSDLTKKGLEPSKALLGITFFERFAELGVAPSQVDQWFKLVKIFSLKIFRSKTSLKRR